MRNYVKIEKKARHGECVNVFEESAMVSINEDGKTLLLFYINKLKNLKSVVK